MEIECVCDVDCLVDCFAGGDENDVGGVPLALVSLGRLV